MPEAPIAIVGLAVTLPDAADFEQFHANLSSGLCSVRPVSRWRRWFTNEPLDVDYPMGSVDRIDLFDNEFFRVSDADALAMDPQQRAALELAWRAMEDAGIRRRVLGEGRTGVFLSAATSGYGRLLGRTTTLSMLGTAPAAISGRVSYHLGLRGPSVAVETGCSGSLVAVAQAVDALRAGRCDHAFAGGVSLRVSLPTWEAMAKTEIMSADGLCRAFDADADGTADGEGGAVLLLKPLDRALRDRDNIHAVIRSVVVNHNAARAVGLSAPSTQAQVELLLDAWEEAGISPRDLGFVEAHGSGTPLGDAVELSALATAFGRAGAPGHACAVGSVKTNIGHLDQAAGIAGLVKAVVALENRTIYPSLHYRTPNPDAVLDGSGIAVSVTAAALGEGERAAGVSSFSLTGTNAHAVVTTPPPRERGGRERASGQVVTLSARSAAALERHCERMAEYVEDRAGLSLSDLAYTLNAGREEFPVRHAWVVRDTAEFVRQARSGAEGRLRPATAAGSNLVVVLPDEVELEEHPVRAGLVRALAERGEQAPDGATGQELAYRLVAAAGLAPSGHIATGRGRHTLRAVRGTAEPPAAGTGASPPAAGPEAAPPIDLEGVRAAVTTLQQEPTLFLVLGPDGSRLARAVEEAGAERMLHFPSGDIEQALNTLVATASREGVQVDWERHHRHLSPRRVTLPTYPFERRRLWPLQPGQDRPGEHAATTSATPAEVRTPDDVEQALRRILGDVLKVPDLGPEPDYFSLGGNSILGLEVIDRIGRELGVRLPLPDLYFHPTLVELTRHVVELQQSGDGAATGAVVTRREQADYPLSHGQESLWFLQRLDPDSSVYNVTIDMRLRGELDTAALRRAVSRLVERHEVLRSRYVPAAGGQVRAVVDPPGEVALPVVDLPESAGDRLAALVKELALTPYDLERGPLYRLALIRMGENDHLLVFGTHHSVDDGWSPAIVDRELSAFYLAETSGAEPDLPPLTIQYGDFATWQRNTLTGDTLAGKIGFWTGYLDQAQPLELPTDHPRPPKLGERGGHVFFTMTAEQLAGLRVLAQRERCTLFTATLTLYKALMHLYTGNQDLVMGTIVAGRDLPETRDMIGYFNNMVTIRTSARDRPSFRTLLRRLRRSFLSTIDHHDVPFTKVVEALRPPRDLSRHPIFQVGFTYQNIPRLPHRMGGLAQRRSYDQHFVYGLPPDRAPWDLNLTIWDIEGESSMTAVLEYSKDLFEQVTVERMGSHFLAVLDRVLATPDVPLAELGVLTEAEREDAMRDAVRPFDEGASLEEAHLLDVAGWVAREEPGRAALVSGRGTVGYAKLLGRARRRAHGLVARGVRPGDTVAMSLPRSEEAVVTILGAWLAGAAYLPLTAGTPPARRQRLLATAGATLLVTGEHTAEHTGEHAGEHAAEHTGEVATCRPEELDVAGDGALPPPDLDRPAYVIFTSGSTGTPKGVLVAHRALVPFLAAWRALRDRAGANLRVLSLATTAFDVFTGDVLRALGTGGSLVLAGEDAVRGPRELRATIEEFGVNTVELVPAHLRAELIDLLAESGGRLGGVRLLCCGLESWRESELRTTRRYLDDDALIVNIFGVTEAAIDSLCSVRDASAAGPVDGDDRLVPVGRPYPGVRAYVLDEALRPAPAGVIGELHLGGGGLALGYASQAALTADRFVPDPFAAVPGARMYRTGDLARRRPGGELEFLGRVDDQIKVHGFRVEPGEIESSLRAHPDVLNAVVRARGSGRDAALIAFLVPARPRRTAGAKELRAFLRGTLPDYLVPHRYTWLAELPMAANGKVDLDALDALSATLSAVSEPASAVSVPPRDRAELSVVRRFEQTLGLAPVGVHDNFFDLGGHSLLAVRLLTELEQDLDVQLPLNVLFECPTPAALAQLVQSDAVLPAAASLVELSGGGPGTPVVLVPPSGGSPLSYYPFAKRLGQDRVVLGLSSLGLNGEDEPLEDAGTICERFVKTLTDHGLRGPLVVGGWSFGGTLAQELALRLAEAGIEVPLVVPIDAAPVDLRPHRLPGNEHELLRYLLVLDHDYAIPDEELDGLDADGRLARVLQLAQDEGHFSGAMTPGRLRVLLRLLRANEEAVLSHRPRRWDGELLLLRTAGGPEPGVNLARDLGWAAYAGRVAVREVPGTHFSVVPAEHQALGAALHAELLERRL
ncbi:amino acid adenylation domain-containing protein [Nonomuraea sp. PA05]|uniref:non-ribosomal peptide synthetase n=1 Tax=Nonomuraea sp. PA05 TaxID=2604466 RepID=UPI0011D997D6|nr:non-ribosomal peptide synthetase [Nonomuraea sp. PA05]TYB55404.1 amino acid adenylation domain-containing protein [Nonomuraea sp. PA05]